MKNLIETEMSLSRFHDSLLEEYPDSLCFFSVLVKIFKTLRPTQTAILQAHELVPAVVEASCSDSVSSQIQEIRTWFYYIMLIKPKDEWLVDFIKDNSFKRMLFILDILIKKNKSIESTDVLAEYKPIIEKYHKTVLVYPFDFKKFIGTSFTEIEKIGLYPPSFSSFIFSDKEEESWVWLLNALSLLYLCMCCWEQFRFFF